MPETSPPSSPVNPPLVELTRGPLVESVHRGAAALFDPRGACVAAWGDIDRPVFPRSAIKPLQALAVVESGAAARFAVTDRELALACASHGGEPVHVEAVLGWLTRMGLGEDDLECGPHAPTDPAAAAELCLAGTAPGRRHNNCSGKHAGMLAAALTDGDMARGYTAPDHPVQRRVREILEAMGGSGLAAAPRGIDGCGVPTWGLPLAALATAMARLARPESLRPSLAAAAARVCAAVAAHPYMVAGRGRFCTRVMTATGADVLVKTGAEGVYVAALPGPGLGIAVKIDDGAKRAAECALAALLLRRGGLGAEARALLAGDADMVLYNWAGTAVGRRRPAAGWPG